MSKTREAGLGLAPCVETKQEQVKGLQRGQVNTLLEPKAGLDMLLMKRKTKVFFFPGKRGPWL